MKRLHTIAILAVSIFIFFCSGLTAHTENGGALSFNIISLPENKIPYISIVDLAEKFNVPVSYDPVMLKMTVKRGTTSLTVINHSQTALLNTSSINLIFPVCLIQGAMFAPVQTFLPLFSDLIPGTLTWDADKKKIESTGNMYSIEKITFENREGGTLIRIALAEPLQYYEKFAGNNWLNIRFQDGTYDPNNIFENAPTGLVEEISHFQHEGEAYFSFKVSNETGNYSIAKISSPEELLVSLRNKKTGAGAASVPLVLDNKPLEPSVNRELWTIDTVVIDPGHGGKDPGAIGPGGTKEKDIVLAVARELKKITDKHGEFRAVLTRDRDVFLPLKQRAAIADSANGKLFISIHANAHPNKRVSGMEIYFLSVAKTESAKRVADLENKAIEFEDNPEYYTKNLTVLRNILMDMRSNVYLKESQDMCKLMLDSCVTSTKQSSRGVKQAGFYVMLGTQALMPSILFELGYISNPDEEKLLRRVSHQKRIAEAMYQAIIAFKKLAERDLITRGD